MTARYLKSCALATMVLSVPTAGCLSDGHVPFAKLLPSPMTTRPLAEDPEFRKEVEKDPFPSGPMTAKQQSE